MYMPGSVIGKKYILLLAPAPTYDWTIVAITLFLSESFFELFPDFVRAIFQSSIFSCFPPPKNVKLNELNFFASEEFHE